MFEDDLKSILEQKWAGKKSNIEDSYNPDLPDYHFKLWWEYLRRNEQTKFDYIWADVFTPPYDNFQEWLKDMKYYCGMIEDALQSKSLRTYREYALEDIEQVIRYLRLKLKRSPELDELLSYYKETPHHRNETYIIEPWNLPPDQTVKLVKDKIKEYGYRKSPIQYEQLEKYLKIYDLKQEGKTTSEIAEIVYPDHGGYAENIARDIRKCLSKAKVIIQNAKRGHFPGPY